MVVVAIEEMGTQRSTVTCSFDTQWNTIWGKT